MKKLFLYFLVTISIIVVFSSMESVIKVQAASKTVINTAAKIDHLTWSLKNNYLGIKNQAQWEVYIKEARILINMIPSSEYVERDKLKDKVDKAEKLIQSVARINQVEKSMENNFHGIKNANQWNEYITLAESDLSKVDKSVFRKEYENLITRMEKCKELISYIEEEFEIEYSEALTSYKNARETMFLKDANKALSKAENLGTCEKSNELEKKCKSLINEIETLTIDIKSVSIKSDTYDDDRRNQSIPLLVNGEVISIEFLKVAGYNVDFHAENIHGSDDEVFVTGANSSTGQLKDKLPKGEYIITVTLTKGEERFISEDTKIRVINLDFNVSEIKGYTMKNLGDDDNDFIQNSNILLVGERASISSLTILVDDEILSATSDIVVKSNNNSILTVENNILRARSKGKVVVTVYYNGVKKNIDIEVKEGTRNIEKIETKDLELIVGKNVVSKLSLRDQYGDPIDYRDIAVSIQGINQIESAKVEYKKLGEAVIKVKAGNIEGIGAIHLKNKEGKLLKTIQIDVSKVDNVDSLSIDIAPKNNEKYSSDNTIFENSSLKDKFIKYRLSIYNTEGVHNGYVNLKGYRIVYDRNLLSITGQEDGVFGDVKSFTVSGKKAGETDIAIFYPNNSLAVRTKIKVLPYENSINSIKWKDTETINYVGENINLYTALDMVKSSNDDIVNNIGLEFATHHRVRVAKSSYANKGNSIESGSFYIDKDGDGLYSKGDSIAGKITLRYIDLGNNSSSNSADIYEGITTKRGDNLIAIFTITNLEAEVVDTLSIKVEVK